jgi:hypothetical protein
VRKLNRMLKTRFLIVNILRPVLFRDLILRGGGVVRDAVYCVTIHVIFTKTLICDC